MWGHPISTDVAVCARRACEYVQLLRGRAEDLRCDDRVWRRALRLCSTTPFHPQIYGWRVEHPLKWGVGSPSAAEASGVAVARAIVNEEKETHGEEAE